MIEGEQAAAEDAGDNDDRSGEAIDADAAGLECRYFVRLREHAERHQDAHEDTDGRGIIEELRRQEEQVCEHALERDLVADDVAQQFEERVDVRDHHEGEQHNGEPEEEARKHVCVDQLRQKDEAAGAADRGSWLDLRNGAAEFAPDAGEQVAEVTEEVAVTGRFEAKHQNQAENREKQVRGPHGEFHGNAPLAGDIHHADLAHVVREREAESQHEGRGFRGAAGRYAERNSDESEQHACERKR